MPLITAPGAYPNIDGDLYHSIEICPAPSISSSGLKRIDPEHPFERGAPAIYWHDSPLNPNRPKSEQKAHFNVGKALHDALAPGGAWPSKYHILPDGFHSTHSRFAYAKAERDAAIRRGMPVLSYQDGQMVDALAESVEKDELARALLISGTPEMTLAAIDPHTGMWIRARPDILPDTRDIVPDIKTAISANPMGYDSTATRLGYFQSAAHYIDTIDLIYGAPAKPRRFVLIVVEKEPPYIVQLYWLDDDDIQKGRMLNRRALNIFAQCVKSGVWPGYSTTDKPIRQLSMPGWARAQIDQQIELGKLSWEGV